jgi:hypothetical protein
MKRWALLVAVLYLVLLAPAVNLAWMAAFPNTAMRAVTDPAAWPAAYRQTLEWIIDSYLWVLPVLLVVTQLCLLVVPVRLGQGRPTSRRWLAWPLLGALLATLVLAAGTYLCIDEALNAGGAMEGLDGLALLAAACLWLPYALLFGFYTGGREPRTTMQHVVHGLVAGSILELLVAVPTHVLARSRHYCCAGFSTFVGIAAGAAVMLLAFGPAVLWLFARRYRRLKGLDRAGPAGTMLGPPPESALGDGDPERSSAAHIR